MARKSRFLYARMLQSRVSRSNTIGIKIAGSILPTLILVSPSILTPIAKMRIEPADDHVAGQIVQINIELYTNEKDFETEQTVEEILDKYSLIYSKGETYLKDESMYEVLYITEAVIDRVEVTNEN